jgi:hypothetical protein
MHDFDRRDFIRRGGIGLAMTLASGFWFDLLARGATPLPSTTLFEDRFGVTREDMKKILELALTKGGEFSELFFEYKISNTVRMEEDIIKDSSENISLGVGIRVLKGAQTGYGYTDDLTFESMKRGPHSRHASGDADQCGKPYPDRSFACESNSDAQSAARCKVDLVKQPMPPHSRMTNASPVQPASTISMY